MPTFNTAEVNALFTRALADDHFRADLLDGRRAECLAEFDFKPAERFWLQTIPAETLEDLVKQVHQQLRPEPQPRLSLWRFSPQASLAEELAA